MKIIGIDAGHGGNDSGAAGIKGTLEKEINLKISLLVEKYLNQVGFKTYMTRKSDKTVSLSNRSNGLNINKCDIAISIHCDSSDNRNAEHFGIYIIQRGGEAEKIAKIIAKEIKEETGWNWGGSLDGVREANFHILRETLMPAVLIECNFISNPKIEEELVKKETQDKIAKAISKGILRYYNINTEIDTDKKELDWKEQIIQDAINLKLIDKNYGHKPDEVAEKWFVLAVVMNLIKNILK